MLLLFDPKTGKTGVLSGLLLSGRVIIPSLFMFSFVVIFCTKAGVASNFIFLNKFSLCLLGLDFYEFYIFILSLIGGYPIGIKLLNEAVKEGNIQKNRAKELSCFFISSGPGFCVSVIGESFFNSRLIGIILFVSQILSAIILSTIFIKKSCVNKIYSFNSQKLADCFVKSVYDTSSTLINVSSFVILFSFITEYCIKASSRIKILSVLPYFLEITNAVTLTRNIYIISFLLGFGGISVMFQVISIADSFDVNFLKLFTIRVLTGIFSCGFTKLFIKLFKVNYATLSTTQNFAKQDFFSGPSVAVCLFLTVTVFMISIISKKYAGKILEDMI